MVAGGMESISNSSFYLRRSIHIQDACHFDALTDVYSNWHMGEMCGTYGQNNENLNAQQGER